MIHFMRDSLSPDRYGKEYMTKFDTMIISERIDSLIYAVMELEERNPTIMKYKIINSDTLITEDKNIYVRIDTLILPKIFYEHPLMPKNEQTIPENKPLGIVYSYHDFLNLLSGMASQDKSSITYGSPTERKCWTQKRKLLIRLPRLFGIRIRNFRKQIQNGI